MLTTLATASIAATDPQSRNRNEASASNGSLTRRIEDLLIVCGKNAAPGEVYSTLASMQRITHKVGFELHLDRDAEQYARIQRRRPVDSRPQSAHAAVEIHGIARKDFASVKARPPSLRRR